MVSKILTCTLILLLLLEINAEYWKQKKFSQIIKGRDYAIFNFEETAEIIHFNVSCSRPCNVFLMNHIEFLNFQEESSNFTESFKEEETFSSSLTVVNFKFEKQYLLVQNVLSNQEISSFCILKEHIEKQRNFKKGQERTFTLLYIIIFGILSYFMNKNFKN